MSRGTIHYALCCGRCDIGVKQTLPFTRVDECRVVQGAPIAPCFGDHDALPNAGYGPYSRYLAMLVVHLPAVTAIASLAITMLAMC